jgi:hypothetical protein
MVSQTTGRILFLTSRAARQAQFLRTRLLRFGSVRVILLLRVDMDNLKHPDIERWATANGVEYPVAVMYLAQRGLWSIEAHARAGRASQAKLTDEEKSARGRAAIQARWARVKGTLHA